MKSNIFSRTRTILVLILVPVISGSIFFSCQHEDPANANLDDAGIKGKVLSQKFCASCHLFPEPSLADRSTWIKGILPQMGPRLGIFRFNTDSYPSSRYDINLIGKHYYPDKPLMSLEEWGQILTYYDEAAPDSLPKQERKTPIHIGNALFEPVLPARNYDNPVTTFLSVDTTASPHRLLQCEGLRHAIYIYNSQMNPIDSILFSGTVLDLISSKDSMIICNVGLINPNDGRFGTVYAIPVNNKNANRTGRGPAEAYRIADSLRRPVQLTAVDLNGDGKRDYVVCEFGNLLGDLAWYENLGNEKFSRHVLRAEPGAINTIVNDYNHDGLPDLWVLFSQGDEAIVLFTNKGNGKFDQEQVLRFPPINGSSHFELEDFNGDGYPDILYTCGDNADYSIIPKPYHGVYIFLNDGKQHFKQQFFYPIHGCYKAIAKDFDGDGDLDIATIAFFADYSHQPEEGFVYLENKGNWNFEASTLKETELGRWLTMDVGDLDGDGKPDIVLGNFSVGPSPGKSQVNWKKGPPLLLLKNKGGVSK